MKPFSVGDLVLLKNEERNQNKLDPKYKGPFKITRVLENDRYEVTSIDGRRQYKYPHDRMRSMPRLDEINPSDILSESDTDEAVSDEALIE